MNFNLSLNTSFNSSIPKTDLALSKPDNPKLGRIALSALAVLSVAGCLFAAKNFGLIKPIGLTNVTNNNLPQSDCPVECDKYLNQSDLNISQCLNNISPFQSNISSNLINLTASKNSPHQLEFLNWLKEDSARLTSEENVKKLISTIKNEEVTEKGIRLFFDGLTESIVLQILNFAQTANSFNAVNEKIIEKALIIETNFIQALNKKYPHRNPELRAKIEQRTLGPTIFTHSMSEEEVQKTGIKFLEDLRISGRLLTNQEFVDQGHPEGAYWNKRNDFGRILGADYIKRVAEELGLKHIKVPKKIAVLDSGITSIKVTVHSSNLEPTTDQITVFAEDIAPLNRGTTREEVTEFLKILEATGYGDFIGQGNFMLGINSQDEEGIYFVDTEYMNFRHIPFLENHAAEAITTVVQPKDWDWINAGVINSYYGANKQRINRYFQLYGIQEANLLGNLLKTYVPPAERRTDSVQFTYNIADS